MASNYRDLWLGIGFVTLGYCAALCIHKQLVAVRKLSEVHPQKETIGPEERSADDIKLDTLAMLVSNVNRDIGLAAKRIIAERASQGLPYELLLRDLIGDDTAKRDRSMVSLRYLHETVSTDVLKPYYGTFVAVVDCLCTKSMSHEILCYEEQRRKGVEFYRSQPFNNTLQLLNTIILDANVGVRDPRHGLLIALRAGVISRWLAKYPWGGLDTNEHSEDQRRKIFSDRMRDPKGDKLMSQLIFRLACDISMRQEDDASGLWQLYKHGLIDTDIVHDYRPMLEDQDHGNHITTSRLNEEQVHLSESVMPNIEMTETSQGPGTNVMSNPSTSMGPPQGFEESFEERMLRQRRREAMGIGEEGRSFDLAPSSIARQAELRDRDNSTRVIES